jgi:hypothetical protein
MRIRDLGWKRFGSGMEKVGSGIRDKHPGSATLVEPHYNKLSFKTFARILDPSRPVKEQRKITS